jgi:hypothetical protein
LEAHGAASEGTIDVFGSGIPDWNGQNDSITFANVVHRHFLWFKVKAGYRDSSRSRQYAVPEISATESDDEPHYGFIVTFRDRSRKMSFAIPQFRSSMLC